MPALIGSRPLSGDELARCLRVAGELAQVGEAPGTDQWIAPNGAVVHGVVSKIGPEQINAHFLNQLRLHSFFFSGYRLTNLLGETSLPCWNDDFARHFDPQRTAPDWSLPAFQAYTRELDTRQIYSPPLIMGEVGYDVNGRCVNRDVVAYQERINLLREFGILDRLESRDTPLIVEIGGGYGALAQHLKQRIPGATYVIMDLPRSLLFSGCYLAAALPGVEVRVFGPETGTLAPGAVHLVPNFLLHRLPALVVDCAINTLSFAEMPAATVAEYARWLQQHLAADGLLFEQNFDNRGLGAAHFSNPESVLTRHLRLRRKVHRGLHWGSAGLWEKNTVAPLLNRARNLLVRLKERFT